MPQTKQHQKKINSYLKKFQNCNTKKEYQFFKEKIKNKSKKQQQTKKSILI